MNALMPSTKSRMIHSVEGIVIGRSRPLKSHSVVSKMWCTAAIARNIAESKLPERSSSSSKVPTHHLFVRAASPAVDVYFIAKPLLHPLIFRIARIGVFAPSAVLRTPRPPPTLKP